MSARPVNRSYTVCNAAGGDERRFRADRHGRPSARSIRHALRIMRDTQMYPSVSDDQMYDAIMAAIDEEEE